MDSLSFLKKDGNDRCSNKLSLMKPFCLWCKKESYLCSNRQSEGKKRTCLAKLRERKRSCVARFALRTKTIWKVKPENICRVKMNSDKALPSDSLFLHSVWFLTLNVSATKASESRNICHSWVIEVLKLQNIFASTTWSLHKEFSKHVNWINLSI